MATSSQYGAFIPTNWVWEIQQVQQSKDISPELKELLIRLYQNLNREALVLNVKETGQYPLMETVNGQLYFPNPHNNSSTAAIAAQRQVLRTVLNFGSLPNAATKSVAHNINVTASTSWTRIYGVTTLPGAKSSTISGYPIPNVDVINPIAINVDSTNVNITTITNLSAYSITYVVLEYIQS